MSDGEKAAGSGQAKGEEDVDVLSLAGQRLRPAWMLVSGVEGHAGGEFLGHFTDTAHGGDVLLQVAPSAPEVPGLPAARVGVYAVVAGRLIPVALWKKLELQEWPEDVRTAVSFAMGMLTELEEHGADLGPFQAVNPAEAVIDATGGVPPRITFPDPKVASLLP